MHLLLQLMQQVLQAVVWKNGKTKTTQWVCDVTLQCKCDGTAGSSLRAGEGELSCMQPD